MTDANQLADALDAHCTAAKVMVDTDLLRSAAAALRGLEAVRVAAQAFDSGCHQYCNDLVWGPNGDQPRPASVPPCGHCRLRAALAAVEVSDG